MTDTFISCLSIFATRLFPRILLCMYLTCSFQIAILYIEVDFDFYFGREKDRFSAKTHSHQRKNKGMTHTKKVATRADAVANRARILEAAHTLFTVRGLELEMQDVATHAGLGLGTLYGHFANREDLLRAILQSVIDDALSQLRTASASHPENPRAALQALVSTGVRVQDQYRPLSGVLRDLRLINLMEPSYVSQVRRQFLEIPKDLLSQGMHMGVFRQDLDQDLAAVIIMGSFMSVMDLLETYLSLDELAERLTHSLLMMFTGNAAGEKEMQAL
jgi:AcrR family transcriptional regulator